MYWLTEEFKRCPLHSALAQLRHKQQAELGTVMTDTNGVMGEDPKRMNLPYYFIFLSYHLTAKCLETEIVS